MRALPLLLLAVAACAVEKSPRSADSATFTVSAHAAGPIRVGMSIEELKSAAGDLTPPANAEAECVYVHPALAPPGVLAMLVKGVVTRIDVDSGGVPTADGVGVGDTASKVNETYAGRVTVTPHKYVQGGHYLTVQPAALDDSLRIVFESEAGRITRYRVGRIPQVEWVERCG